MLKLLNFVVNGEPQSLAVEPSETLAETLRERLRLTGTKLGCEKGECGACTVLIDGKPALSCLTLSLTMQGKSVDTVEGLARDGKLSRLQSAFLQHSAIQCGFCTPGMLVAGQAAIDDDVALTDEVIRERLSGNLCRCTGYQRIVDAVKQAADVAHTTELPVEKIDAVQHATGASQFAADISLPRMLFAKMLRSPHAHAKIISIDKSRAENYPGVVAVMTGAELKKQYGVLPASMDETVLAVDQVRFVGDGVAAVAALDERTAQEALLLIDVKYELLAPVLTIDDSLRDDLPKLHPETKYSNNVAKHVELDFGDTDAGFAEADFIREDEYFYDANTHAMIEPHSAIASFEAPSTGDDYRKGHLTLWSSTQAPHYVHRALASVFDMPASRIRVIKPSVGSGFGGKSEPFALEFCVSWLSIKTGRPVKLTYTREEVFYSHRGRHATRMKLKTGVKRDGTITAIAYQAWLDGGAYGSFGLVTSYYTGQFLTLPYRVSNFKFESWRCYTNKPPSGPKRGHGAVQPRFAFEAQLDRIAEMLEIDPAELRLKNLIEPNTTTINALRVTSCGIRECIEKVVAASNWHDKFGKLPPGHGIGIAASAYISGAGKEVNWLGLPHSGAIVKIDRGGGVAVFCGSSDIGQGSNTMLATVVAKTLGIGTASVRVFEADTDLTPIDLGSYSSRVTFMAGNAALSAAKQLQEKILLAVSEKLSLDVAALELKEQAVFYKSECTPVMDFITAARAAEAKFGTLAATGWYAPPKLGGTYKGAGAGPSPAYSFTAQVVELFANRETGEVTIQKVWTAHDCGKAINRSLVEGQLEGCVYMGIGEALHESLDYTGARRDTPGGLLRSVSLLEYKIPTTLDTPPMEIHIVETMDPEGPLGAKEAGEGPILSVVPAVANALYDALGVRLTTVPMLPENIVRAVREQK